MKHNYKPQQSNATLVHEPLSSTTDFDDSNRRWPSKVAMSGSAGQTAEDMDGEDLIEDDYDSYDEIFTQHFPDEKLSQLDGTKIVPTSLNKRLSTPLAKNAKSKQKPINNTKRFLLPAQPSSKIESPDPSSPSSKEELPWAQRYAPLTLEELAVHKRKVRDVEQWLDDALTGKSRKNLLVLKGPAGSGKTATVSLLADKLDFNILEWKSPSTSGYATKDYVSLGAQFDEFLGRGHKFGSLDLGGSDVSQSSIEGGPGTSQRRIILIEEFPTISGRNFSVLAAFRLSLLRYLSLNSSPARDDYDVQAMVPPIVMIVSETYSNSDSSADNLTVHRLLGRQLYNHPSTTIVEFNSIAPTFMYKALSLVLKKSARHPTGSQVQTQSMLESICKVGDIRNAIASIEFLCLGSDRQTSWSDRAVRPSRSTRTRKKLPVEAPKEITQRGANLGLFHAVGKIVYNKRDDYSNDEESQLPSPPDHLRDFNRPRASQVHVNELPDETGTDIQTFIGALHENYVPSCNGPSFTEYLDGCIGALSDSDLLCADRKGHDRYQAGLGTGFLKSGASSDLLRQEEISFQVAARGLLFALPCPVTRHSSYTSNTKRTNDFYKLSFPPAIRLVRRMEEIEGLIDLCTDALLNSTMRPTAVPLLGAGFSTFRKSTPEAGGHMSDHDDSSVAMVAMISRSDLILDQLPYMTMICKDAVKSSSLERITGFGAQGSNYSLQQGEESAWESSLQDHNASHFRTERGNSNNWTGPQAPLVPQTDDERFVLSDDEIVDDG
ncbi:hypothetical protein BDV12DRAFT_150980 [Aspergillus spectabilis]